MDFNCWSKRQNQNCMLAMLFKDLHIMHYISVVWHRLFSIKHNIDGWSLNIILSFKRKKEKKKKKKKKKKPFFLTPIRAFGWTKWCWLWVTDDSLFCDLAFTWMMLCRCRIRISSTGKASESNNQVITP